jgi:prevent-host-death family protein
MRWRESVDLVLRLDQDEYMVVVNVHEAKTNLSKLLERVRAGEEIIIAKSGKPYARLCPLDPPEPRRPGLLAGKLDQSFFDPLPEEELEAWEK